MSRCAAVFYAICLISPAAPGAEAAPLQIEQARQRTRLDATSDAAPGGFSDFPDLAPATAEENAPSEERARTFGGFAEISAFITDNVLLTKNAREDDRYLVATTAASMTQQFGPQLRADVAARGSAYRYDRFPGLDFQSLDLSVGVTWIPPQLGGVEIQVRYIFTDYTTRHGDEFYTGHAILLGVQKSYAIDRAQTIYGGLSGQWGWSDPKISQRDEYSVFAGYRLQVTRNIDANLSYRYSRYIYGHSDGRQDDNQVVALTWRYAPFEWASISATSYFARNCSTQSPFNYEAFTGGIALQFAISF